MTDLGVCRNVDCESARSRTPVERYPGPGEYCPTCGELLHAIAPIDQPPAAAENQPAPPQPPAETKTEPPRRGFPTRKSVTVLAAAAAIAILVVVGLLRLNAAQPHAAAVPVRVNSPSALNRVARTIDRAGAATRIVAQTAPTAATPMPTSMIAAKPTPQPTQKPTQRPVPTPQPTRLPTATPLPTPQPTPTSGRRKGSHSSKAAQRPPAHIAGLRPGANTHLSPKVMNLPLDVARKPEPTQGASVEPSTNVAAATRPLEAPVTPRTATPPSCARPDVPAAIVRAAVADKPAMADQQGISGTVQVIVSLNAQSRVVATRVQSSPSTLLNVAALTAARNSQFRTQTKNCEAAAADYVLNVIFQ